MCPKMRPVGVTKKGKKGQKLSCVELAICPDHPRRHRPFKFCMLDRSTIEAIHETCRTYECPEFSGKFTTYMQLSYASRKSENLTDNQQLGIVLLFTYANNVRKTLICANILLRHS